MPINQTPLASLYDAVLQGNAVAIAIAALLAATILLALLALVLLPLDYVLRVKNYPALHSDDLLAPLILGRNHPAVARRREIAVLKRDHAARIKRARRLKARLLKASINARNITVTRL